MTPFEEIYRLNFMPIYRYALKIVKVREDAEDICSEVFIKFNKVKDKIQDPRLWLFTATKHQVIDFLRNKKIFDELDYRTDIADVTENIKDAVVARLFMEVEKLTPFRRKVIELSIVGLTPMEISKKMGITYQSARNEKCRGLKDLKSIFINNKISPI